MFETITLILTGVLLGYLSCVVGERLARRN